MLLRTVARLTLLIPAALLLTAASAHAQFTPRTLGDPATGERYHIEASADLWMPTTDMRISSEALGIIGTDIDFKKDLGLTDQKTKGLHIVLRPARKHRFRFQYVPLKFEQQATLTRDIVFQGIRYKVGLPVNSLLDWKAYRFTYEYDFIYRDRGFVGFMLDSKYTDVTASLQSPIDYEKIHARAPIPTLGGIARYYVVPNISITGELSGFKIPDSISKQYKAHYADLDIYGTLNVTNNFGAQFGYRTFDLGYTIKEDDEVTTKDFGSFVVKGIYFGAVARF
ncbi:MAG: hypothetical protein JSU08_01960 [Acidobacteria bacterium]|nr:hypothetical protein [Acidobacteriota bacterium]